MKVQLLKRSAIIKNILIFQLLSLAYLQIVQSLHFGISAIDYKNTPQFLADPWIFISFTAAFISTYLATKFASFFFGIFCAIILSKPIMYLFESFDKVILVLIFFYLIFSIYFILFWETEKKEAAYRPGFKENAMGDPG